MDTTTRRFSIFVLGAGFSRPAGLPLGMELWRELDRRARASYQAARYERDLESYLEFNWRCKGVRLNQSDIDFEDFLGFLDTEFYLGLRGPDTWSEEGN